MPTGAGPVAMPTSNTILWPHNLFQSLHSCNFIYLLINPFPSFLKFLLKLGFLFINIDKLIMVEVNLNLINNLNFCVKENELRVINIDKEERGGYYH